MDPGRMVPEQASEAHVADLAVMFAAAFRDDAMIRWPMPDATPAMLAEFFGVLLTPYARSGVLWKIHGYDGAAAWLPPAMAGRFCEIEQSTRAAINPLTGGGGARYAAFWDWLNAHLPDEPGWFLDLVAVAPSAQGRGLGRRLVAHGLERAQADGYPAFLETGTPASSVLSIPRLPDRRPAASPGRRPCDLVHANPAHRAGPTGRIARSLPGRHVQADGLGASLGQRRRHHVRGAPGRGQRLGHFS